MHRSTLVVSSRLTMGAAVLVSAALTIVDVGPASAKPAITVEPDNVQDGQSVHVPAGRVLRGGGWLRRRGLRRWLGGVLGRPRRPVPALQPGLGHPRTDARRRRLRRW